MSKITDVSVFRFHPARDGKGSRPRNSTVVFAPHGMLFDEPPLLDSKLPVPSRSINRFLPWAFPQSLLEKIQQPFSSPFVDPTAIPSSKPLAMPLLYCERAGKRATGRLHLSLRVSPLVCVSPHVSHSSFLKQIAEVHDAVLFLKKHYARSRLFLRFYSLGRTTLILESRSRRLGPAGKIAPPV